MPTKPNPFSLKGILRGLPSARLSKNIEHLLESAFSLKQLEKLYQELPDCDNEQGFLQQVFDTFNIRYRVTEKELAYIPQSGPLLIVANHPFGAIEGVIMADLLRKIRPDVKIMANHLLKRLPEISDLFIAVDPFGGNQAKQKNIGPMKEAIRWLKQGGVLVVFPAGEVSHYTPNQRKIIDPLWNANIARLIHINQCPVQSLYFHGNNSLLFQLAGILHPRLRTALLPRELINKADTTIPIRINQPLPYKKLKDIGTDAQLMAYLKLRTYMLKDQLSPSKISKQAALPQETPQRDIEPAKPADWLQQEIAQLSDEQCLVDNGDLKVYCADAKQIPHTLHELGRLREVTFRATGEGTGKSIDLDIYDNYYLHLFIWHSKRHEVVGAYRLGLGDKIMERFGKRGFYSHSLFKYRSRLINQLNPAIELGRSFIREEYQRSFAPLMLLWKGIGAYIALHPHYRKLFGPVSISSDYQHSSQQLMVDFLRVNNRLPELARLVKPRSPFKGKGIQYPDQAASGFKNIDSIAQLISEIEQDNKGIPILLKQYLKLGGTILEFNVDDQFNNALDGLIMVDLLHTDPKVLGKYMGTDAAQYFLQHHQSSNTPAQQTS